MKTILFFISFFVSVALWGQPIEYRYNYRTQKQDMILKYRAVMDSVDKMIQDSARFYVEYGCSSGTSQWFQVNDTIFIDTCYASSGKYVLGLNSGSAFSPGDGLTYYFANGSAANTNESLYTVPIPVAGTITGVIVRWYATSGVNGTGEDIIAYIRLNGATDILIDTIGTTDQQKIFSNYTLSQAVTVEDKVSIKIVSPTWATNPALITLCATITIEY